MATLEIFGQVNEQGELEMEKPEGLHAGRKVKVTITELDDLPEQGYWGKGPVALLDQPDLSDWASDEMNDPVE